jgi:hypothetical protein
VAEREDRSGPALVKDVLEEWRQSFGEADPVEALPQPSESRVLVEDDGDGITVRYPVTNQLIVWFAAGLAALAIPVLAFGVEWDPAGAEALRQSGPAWRSTLIGWIQGSPRIWAAAFTLIGGFLVSAFLGSPRRVRITRDAVFVLRGLRPWPRRYPRPRYSRVIQQERLVSLARGKRVSLFMPSLAPVLASAMEARWVASVLRAAMRRTADGRSAG